MVLNANIHRAAPATCSSPTAVATLGLVIIASRLVALFTLRGRAHSALKQGGSRRLGLKLGNKPVRSILGLDAVGQYRLLRRQDLHNQTSKYWGKPGTAILSHYYTKRSINQGCVNQFVVNYSNIIAPIPALFTERRAWSL